MAAKGHEDQFPMPGTSARYGFRKGTFAGMRRYDEDAPIPAVRFQPSARRRSNWSNRPTAVVRLILARRQNRSFISRLFDHLVGAGEDRLRHGEAERLCGLEVNDQLNFRGLLNRKIGWLRASQNPTNIVAELTM